MLLVVGAVVDMVANHETEVCLTYTYIQRMNMVFVVLHIVHSLVLEQITYDSAYLTLQNHVFCV